MGFFSRKQKAFAKCCTSEELKRFYVASESRLKDAAQQGNEKALKKEMSLHKDIEYSMLYSNTPEFKKRKRKNYGSRRR